MVNENTIGRPCEDSCPYRGKCRLNFRPRRLIRAHEYSFGTGTKVTVAADGTREYSCENLFGA
eukprot:4924508-Pleurochrysis_carterae.AAC.1